MKINPEEHIGLAHSCVYRFLFHSKGHLWYLKDDLLGVAMLELVEAAQEYNGKCKNIQNYLWSRILQALRNYMNRSEYKNKSGVVYLEDLQLDDVTHWDEIIPGTSDDLQLIFKRLPEDLQEFVEVLLNSRTYKEARETLGISWKSFYKKIKEVKSKIY